MIRRFYHKKLYDLITPGKVFVLYGPRQVGKTTLINHFCDEFDGTIFRSTGEDLQLQEILANSSVQQLKLFFEDYDLIFIDEAQMIPNAGQALKIIVDQIPDLSVVVTGSSSFKLSSAIGEPLVGRQRIKKLYPISLLELKSELGWFDVKGRLDEFMIYGMYPELFNMTSRTERIDYLHQIKDGYLFKDLLMLENLRNSNKVRDLLKLIAFQIGNEVSHQELGKQLGMSKNTVARYLDLLEKAFVLINVRGFSRNLRKEVVKTSRYYFYDNGIRNALINNFNDLNTRNDVGQLWENFMFIERMKMREYKQIHAETYFWRTYDQKEIDLVEQREGNLFGYEFKHRQNKSISAPADWQKAYPDAEFKVISRDNIEEFVLN
jgi:predicted AAA+ superfamily ATPase